MNHLIICLSVYQYGGLTTCTIALLTSLASVICHRWYEALLWQSWMDKGGERWGWSIGRMIIGRKKQKYLRKLCSSAT